MSRVYFRAGARGAHEKGWYCFWTVERDDAEFPDPPYITVRVPEDKRDISDRLVETFSMGGYDDLLQNHSRIVRSHPYLVAGWLSGHPDDSKYAVLSDELKFYLNYVSQEIGNA